jgi:outer membrane protein assembly factor BamC
MQKIASISVLLLAMSACSTLDNLSEDSKIDYRSARQRSTLELPPDIASPRSDERFNVPDRNAPATASEQQRRAAATCASASKDAVLPQVSGARIERAGTQRWLVVEREPAKAFEMIREFWLDNGFSAAVDSPATGVFETDWAENRAKLPQDFLRSTLGKVLESFYSTGERDKFRTRIEPGANGSTEIYLSHRGLIEVYEGATKDRTVWTGRPIDPDLEAEFLRRMLMRFGVSKQAASQVVTAAATQKAPDRARIVGTGAQSVLQVDESFDRAWRRIGLSLDRVGFTVEDRDRNQGIFFVRFVDPEVEAQNSKPGLWDRLTGNKADVVARQFRIKVSSQGAPTANGVSNTAVVVLDKQGQSIAGGIESQLATRILDRLRDDLK